ncbi:MmcQ/YjbR family DNA-binding protein, partial [Psychrobacter sp. 16-MNA-CIBAN-0192]
MDQQTVHEYLVNKPLVKVTQPFSKEVDVYKVNHKMFATLALGNDDNNDANGEPIWWLNLKCDPDEALALRDMFTAVIPG